MAKAVALTLDALKAPQPTPQAATPARGTMPKAPEPKAAVEYAPIQIRIPKDVARAIKVAAAERDQSITEFMLACFHAYMKSPKHDG